MDSEEYCRQVGRRLRRVRMYRELSLADVETRSGGRWRAATVASYERADRHMKVEDLAELAGFYNLPVWHLLPPEGGQAVLVAA